MACICLKHLPNFLCCWNWQRPLKLSSVLASRSLRSWFISARKWNTTSWLSSNTIGCIAQGIACSSVDWAHVTSLSIIWVQVLYCNSAMARKGQFFIDPSRDWIMDFCAVVGEITRSFSMDDLLACRLIQLCLDSGTFTLAFTPVILSVASRSKSTWQATMLETNRRQDRAKISFVLDLF